MPESPVAAMSTSSGSLAILFSACSAIARILLLTQMIGRTVAPVSQYVAARCTRDELLAALFSLCDRSEMYRLNNSIFEQRCRVLCNAGAATSGKVNGVPLAHIGIVTETPSAANSFGGLCM